MFKDAQPFMLPVLFLEKQRSQKLSLTFCGRKGFFLG